MENCLENEFNYLQLIEISFYNYLLQNYVYLMYICIECVYIILYVFGKCIYFCVKVVVSWCVGFMDCLNSQWVIFIY